MAAGPVPQAYSSPAEETKEFRNPRLSRRPGWDGDGVDAQRDGLTEAQRVAGRPFPCPVILIAARSGGLDHLSSEVELRLAYSLKEAVGVRCARQARCEVHFATANCDRSEPAEPWPRAAAVPIPGTTRGFERSRGQVVCALENVQQAPVDRAEGENPRVFDLLGYFDRLLEDWRGAA
jgi:hypothetical protein